tara:strand:+ start:925 stop:2667 length:1743 start_codon:yes stop_codon:yes gene_type:complete
MEFEEIKIILKRMYREYVKFHIKTIIYCLFLSVFVAASTSATAWLLDPAVKKIFVEKDQTLAWLIPIAIIFAFATKGISLYFARLNILKIGNIIAGEVQKKVSKSILFSDIQTLESRHSGKYISNFMYDTGQIHTMVSTAVLNIMKDSLSVIFLVGLMFYQNWKLAFFAMIMIPLSAGLAKNLGKKMGKATTQASELSGKLISFLTDIFRSSKMIRIYQKENYEEKKSDSVIESLVNKNIRLGGLIIRAAPIMETLTGIMIAGFIFYSGKLINAGELEVNNFFSFLAAMMLAYQPIRSLATINMTIYQGAAASKRIFAVIDKPIQIKNDNSLPNLKIDNCNIKFNNVDFKYDNTNDKAIKNISMSIEGGKVTALVGPSGAGKSTVINLIPRFYDVHNGSIEIDNQDIKKIKLDSLRKHMALVSQDIVLFDDTIKNNIAYANPDVSDKEIINACKFAAADEFIEKLPKKYDSLVGENGVKLSGGQKQRISIARAIIKNSQIILLDEATSSLDNESERVVQNAINNLIKDRTTIVIAHRLSTINEADKIFVFKDGSIIDSGKHKYLIDNCKEYQSLYMKQLQ